MSDGYEEDPEGKNTQILPAVDGTAPQDLDGTVEMDQKAFFKKMGAEARGDDEVPATLQLPAIDGNTRPQLAPEDRTHAYRVPASIMEKLRDDQDLETLDVSLELIQDEETAQIADLQIAEFITTIDREGRIDVPQRFLEKLFGVGTRVRVVMRIEKD